MRNQATGCAAKVESHIKGQSDKDQLVSSLLIGIERSHPSGQSVQKLDIIPDKPSSLLGIQLPFSQTVFRILHLQTELSCQSMALKALR